MRKPLIAGNWKMNNDFRFGIDEAKKIAEYVETIKDDRDVMLCVPYTSLYTINDEMKEKRIAISSQNMFYEDKGAYTGEISPLMLKDMGIETVLLGHSERRQYFNETDEMINKKVLKAEEHGLNFILCVGETLEQRENGKDKEIIKAQIISDLKKLGKTAAKDMIVAYEPIWAIGTGKTATTEQANEMINYIRFVINGLYGTVVSGNIRILYGGSVKPENVKQIMEEPEIDGVLVGGASLTSDKFNKIINF